MYLIQIVVLLVAQLIELSESSSQLSRHRRFLIVPPTAPTRHQLIWGIGVPVGVPSGESVTSGLVLKAQYYLPTSLDELRPDYLDLEARKIKNKRSVDNYSNETSFYDPIMKMKVERYDVKPIIIDSKLIEDEEYINYEEDYVRRNEEYNKDEELHSQNSRWSVYKMIEGIITEKNGFPGKSCVLKSICEAADAKFTVESGIIGELLHVLLTPSTTKEMLTVDMHEDYLQAERNGKSGKACDVLYRECTTSVLDIFSDVILNPFQTVL